MNSLKDFLISANYELDWLERPEGHSWGLWRATIDRMLEYFFPDNSSDVIAEDLTPSDFILYQNYPNPFNPSTKISWQSSIGSWQTLIVFDILGNEIATLIDEYKPAGNYEVEFSAIGGSACGGNAYNLPSGIYFYQLRVDNFVETKKMLFLK